MITDIKQSLIIAATRLMAEDGYDGVSVRSICQEAKVNNNSITYHFGGKEKLFNAMVDDFQNDLYETPSHYLSSEFNNAGEFRLCLSMFFEESIVRLLKNSQILRILMREGKRVKSSSHLKAFHEIIHRFITMGQDKGIINKNLDPSFVTGAFMDRIFIQVMNHEHITANFDTDITNLKYRKEWIHNNLELFLNGLFVKE